MMRAKQRRWQRKKAPRMNQLIPGGKMADRTVLDMFADMAKQIDLPKIDYEAFVDIHRKNIEAMQKSAAVVSEGGSAVLTKQQEILAEVGREARQLIADFRFSSGSRGQAGGTGQACV
jgi:hypothetical protein